MIEVREVANPLPRKPYNPNWEPWLTLAEVESIAEAIQNGRRKDGKIC